MRKIFFLFVIACAFVALADISGAQGRMNCKGNQGWGSGSQYNRLYDPKTVETLNGEVISVDEIEPMKGMCAGVHLTLKTNKETVSVHLEPSWFIENQDTKIDKQDKIEVKGSRVQFDGKPAIIAAEVSKGDQHLKLRDDNGVPVWSGWRKNAIQ